MNKKITSLFVLLILIISSTACNNDNKKTDSPKTEYTLASEKTDVKDEYKNLDEWQGNWESFVTYCKDKDMECLGEYSG